ncbi:hypothetical protein CBF30_04425 [Vagococcus entomophilus]|uniref:Uncharacterized protein n=1 Tax=Vagococcus entomophilus TaxID=1160095 RepID=A0A430AK58_9ENTE|nr:hypothetical protein CBF30_04425 [Vagococcus entomophilus]
MFFFTPINAPSILHLNSEIFRKTFYCSAIVESCYLWDNVVFNKISRRSQNSVQYTLTNLKGLKTSISRTYEIGLEPKIYGNDATIYLGYFPSVSDFSASATDSSGLNSKVKADFSKVVFETPGTYPVTLSAATGKPWTTDPSILILFK